MKKVHQFIFTEQLTDEAAANLRHLVESGRVKFISAANRLINGRDNKGAKGEI